MRKTLRYGVVLSMKQARESQMLLLPLKELQREWPVIQKETYLPIMVDPSHATGRSDLIYSMSCAAIAAGANGLMIEVHYDPKEALVDGRQMITPDELKHVIDACQRIHKLIAPQKKKD